MADAKTLDDAKKAAEKVAADAKRISDAQALADSKKEYDENAKKVADTGMLAKVFAPDPPLSL